MDTIDKIFNLMGATNTSSYRLEQDAGIPSALVSQWRARKQNPSLKNLKKLAKYFEIPLDYFIREDALPERQTTLNELFDDYRKNALNKLLSAEGVDCAMMAEELNAVGKKKVAEYIDDLIASGKYEKK